ncbi:MAG: macro domain-containing protein [Bacteroidota bacterium]|nr:macro domain-containing protein [Bacteroidota bacterium]
MSSIKFIAGNIFTSNCQTIVNTVNCVGVMGAGIALEIRYRYPDMFNKYAELCKRNEIEIGKLWIYNIPNTDRKILNFPTKKHWKYPSKIEYLEKGLQKFVSTFKEKGITSISFPLLGAQNGGIDPDISISIMEKYLSKCDIEIEIYEYDESAKDDLIDKFYDLFNHYDLEEIKNFLKVNSDTLLEIKNLILHHELNSLFQLTNKKIKGINKKNLQMFYNFLMNLESQVQPETLFAQYVSENSTKRSSYKAK